MIKLHIKIVNNGKFDYKSLNFDTEEDCVRSMEDFINNPNYQTMGYSPDNDEKRGLRYFLNLKKVS